MIRLRYSQLPGITSKVVFAPVIPATLTYETQQFPSFALVDSGAMSGVISTVIADELGISWRKMTAIQGYSVGGVFISHRVENLRISIFDYSFSATLSVVEGIAPYRFILGQSDIFHHAKITFEEYKNQFAIEFRHFN